MDTLKKAELLKAQFDQLTNYSDRIKFCLENFHPGPCVNTAPGVGTYLLLSTEDEDVKHCAVSTKPYHPQALIEWPIVISPMPQMPEEWEINNRLFYHYIEQEWFVNENAEFIKKSFAFRKEEFERRMMNVTDSDEILDEEIKRIFDEYEQPQKKIEEGFIHLYLQVKVFRDNRRGKKWEFPKDRHKWFESFIELIKLVEGEHAYQYYIYLRKLQQTPDWQSSIQRMQQKEVSYFFPCDFVKSYQSQDFSEEIKKNGYLLITYKSAEVKSYWGALVNFLSSQKAEVQNSKTQVIEVVDGTQFLDIYISAFKEGADYFDSKYGVSPNVLFGAEAKPFGEILHHQYYHSKKHIEGWLHWRSFAPHIVSYQIIKDYGYYAGIISRFDDMANEYPEFFKKYVLPPCKTDKHMESEESMEHDRRVVAEIEIPGFDDPAKLQRGVTSLVQQLNAHKGQGTPYLHPFFWHTKIRHPNSSEYVLEINKDEMEIDEAGNEVGKKKVPLTDENIDEAFIYYITSCNTNQIAPFLSFQFEKFYNRLKANESAQPFFDHIINLVDIAIERDILYKTEMDTLIGWLGNNPHYQVRAAQPEPNRLSEKGFVKLNNDFSDYIREEYRDEVLPYLISRYKGQKPKQFVYMLCALADLGIIEKSALANQTELHKGLTTTFGNVGTRQSLQINLSKLSSANRSEEQQISMHKERIRTFRRSE